MLPLILAGASMLSSAKGTSDAQASTEEGAKLQADINLAAIGQRRAIQDDLTKRNKPYYDQGIAQLPSILAMSRNPDFSATTVSTPQMPGGLTPTGQEVWKLRNPSVPYGDKYSLGARDMTLAGMASGGGRNLLPESELMSGFNASEQGRLLNRKLDQLKIGFGQAGTAGQSLMATGSAIAGINDRIGADRANALSLSSLNRQRQVDDTMAGASYAPLYLNYKRLNGEG